MLRITDQKTVHLGQKLTHTLFVRHIAYTVTIHGARNQIRVKELAHVMINGISGKSQPLRYLGTVCGMIPKKAQDIEPSPIAQQMDGIIDPNLWSLGRTEYLV